MSRSVMASRPAAPAAVSPTRRLSRRDPLLLMSFRLARRCSGREIRPLSARAPANMDPETTKCAPWNGIGPDRNPHGAAPERYQPRRREHAPQPRFGGLSLALLPAGDDAAGPGSADLDSRRRAPAAGLHGRD